MGRSGDRRAARRAGDRAPATGWIDVSVPLRTNMVHWPGEPAVRIERIHDQQCGDPSNVSVLSMSSHTGTHIDAPSHFIALGAAVDEMPLNVAVGRARVIEIEDPEAVHADALARHRIRRGERILFKTANSSRGWSRRGFVKDYVHIARDAAEYLARQRVRLVGVDYLSVGSFSSTENRETHLALLRAGIWIIEGLDLRQIQPGAYEMICLPLRIKGGDGSPARAILRGK